MPVALPALPKEPRIHNEVSTKAKADGTDHAEADEMTSWNIRPAVEQTPEKVSGAWDLN